MKNYKYILAAGTAILLPVSVAADTCGTLPSCASIGFTTPSSSLSSKCKDKTYLKCPFGDYYFCSEAKEPTKTCREVIAGLTGSIYYDTITSSYLRNASNTNNVYFDTDRTYTDTSITLKDKARIYGASFVSPVCTKMPTLKLSTLTIESIDMAGINLEVDQLNLNGTYVNWNYVPYADFEHGDTTVDISRRLFVRGPTLLDIYSGIWNIASIDFDDNIEPLVITVTDGDVTIKDTEFVSGKDYTWALCLSSDTYGHGKVTVGSRTYEWTDSGERTVTVNGSVKQFNYLCSSEVYHIESYGRYRVYYGPCSDFLSANMANMPDSTVRSELDRMVRRTDQGKYWECTN